MERIEEMEKDLAKYVAEWGKRWKMRYGSVSTKIDFNEGKVKYIRVNIEKGFTTEDLKV